MPIAIDIPHEAIKAFAQRYPIRRLALFGSVLSEQFDAESDVDVLVEFRAGASVDLFDMAEMADALSAILGRRVDLRTPNELSRYIRESVMTTACPIYDCAT